MRIVVTDRAKSDGGGCQRHPLIDFAFPWVRVEVHGRFRSIEGDRSSDRYVDLEVHGRFDRLSDPCDQCNDDRSIDEIAPIDPSHPSIN